MISNLNGMKSPGTPRRQELDPVVVFERLQVLERENSRLMSNQGQLLQESNRKLELYANEVKNLHKKTADLTEENRELRELCCFLDDERQKAKTLSQEWQRFGRYTANVVQQEVAAYQGKLRELEIRQQDLIKENFELHEFAAICKSGCPHCGSKLANGFDHFKDHSMYSDFPKVIIPGEQEDMMNVRARLGVVTPPDEPVPVIANENHHGRSLSQNDLQENFSFDSGFRSASAVPMINYAKNGLPPNFHQNENDALLNYIRSLESRLFHLESEKDRSSGTGSALSSNHRLPSGFGRGIAPLAQNDGRLSPASSTCTITSEHLQDYDEPPPMIEKRCVSEPQLIAKENDGQGAVRQAQSVSTVVKISNEKFQNQVQNQNQDQNQNQNQNQDQQRIGYYQLGGENFLLKRPSNSPQNSSEKRNPTFGFPPDYL